MQDTSKIPARFTCHIKKLFNVTDYKPGDYKEFYADVRTRADYLDWAPDMLNAEDWHARRVVVEDKGRKRLSIKALRRLKKGDLVVVYYAINDVAHRAVFDYAVRQVTSKYDNAVNIGDHTLFFDACDDPAGNIIKGGRGLIHLWRPTEQDVAAYVPSDDEEEDANRDW